MTKTSPVLSVEKAMALLDLVAEACLSGQPARLSVLAGRMRLPLNSVHNLLKTLAVCGYVEQRGRGVYAAGYKCRQFGLVGRLQTPDVREALAEAMRRFTQAQGEDCVLAVLANGERVVIGYAGADQAVRISPAAMEKVPFYAMPTGRMLAAVAGEAEFHEILARQGMPGRHWNDIEDEHSLRTELAALRKRGSCRIGQKREGLVALSCPIPGADGTAWGVLGTFAPAYRCPAARCSQLLKALLALAKDLSRVVPSFSLPTSHTKGSQRCP